MIYQTAIDYVEASKERLAAAADRIWDLAEIAFQERGSAAILCELLEAEGFSVERGIYGMPTAFTASYGRGAPVVALLGEFDALSGMSQKAGVCVKKPAIPGANGHGCGHHSLGVGSLGAAMAVKRYLAESGIPGTVVYFGCPGEEGGSSKAFMARDGAFSGVDCALSWHPCDTTGLFSGRTLAVASLTYSFKGTSAHAAGHPHLGRSALDAVELMNVGANYLREHVIQEARIHYAITDAGGVSPNVVQPQASVYYYLRAPEPDQVRELERRVADIARGAALMTGTRLSILFHKANASLLPNTALDDVLSDNLRAIPLPALSEDDYRSAAAIKKTIPNPTETLKEIQATVSEEERARLAGRSGDAVYEFIRPRAVGEPLLYGSTDVGDVSMTCPTAQIYCATWAAGTPMHSWQAVAQGKSNLAHQGMLFASKVLACSVLDLMRDPGRVEAAKRELSRRLGGKPFASLMPKACKPKLEWATKRKG